MAIVTETVLLLGCRLLVTVMLCFMMVAEYRKEKAVEERAVQEAHTFWMMELGMVTVMVGVKKYCRAGITVTSRVEVAYMIELVSWMEIEAVVGV